jgi:hypothetical protein
MTLTSGASRAARRGDPGGVAAQHPGGAGCSVYIHTIIIMILCTRELCTGFANKGLLEASRGRPDLTVMGPSAGTGSTPSPAKTVT